MSRSNPQAERAPNPASPYFFEWGGGEGILRRYDKKLEKNVAVPLPFGFLVLDELSTITGFNKRAKTGLYANEVRDVTANPLVVKIHGQGIIANGLYAAIKEEVKRNGGHFACSTYIAFRETKDGPLRIGNIRMTTSSLMPWIEFRKASGEDLFKKAVKMTRGDQQTTGANDYYEPNFKLVDCSKESSEEAVALDRTLQKFLAEYLIRNKAQEEAQTEPATRKTTPTEPDVEEEAPRKSAEYPADADLEDTDVPF